MKKRILTSALAILLALATVMSFASCDKNKGDEQASDTTPATVTEAPTEPATEDPVGAILASPEQSDFRIVYAADASETVKAAAQHLAEALAAAFGTAPEIVDDSTAAAAGCEILVGKTNRKASPLADSTDQRAWCVQAADNLISLDAVREDFLVRAADHLVEAYAEAGSVLGFKMITDYTDNGEAFEKSLHFFVPGEPGYTVVYDAEDGDDAAFTAQWFSKSYSARGYALGLSDKAVDGASVRLDIDAGLATDWAVKFDDKGSLTVSGKDKDALAWGLTVLTGSRMTPDRYGEILITDTSDMSGDMSACTRDGWGLPVPAYEGGKLADAVYNSGSGKENDTKGDVYSQSRMMVVGSTTLEDFEAYVEKLISLGYVADSTTTLKSPRKSDNYFGQYVNGVSTVYAYFLGATSEARIIDDRASVPESMFEYDYAVTPEDGADVILYGLYLHPLGINNNEPGGDPNINNCGEFMMIRQPDNGLILIDGGSKLQATDAAVEGAWKYIRELTGTPEGQKVRISCWFITHPHGDHCAIVGKLLEKYGDLMEVERVMFNYVKADTNGLSLSQASRTSINKYCPDAMILKCHTGQSIKLGGVVLDVMTTHEDIVNVKSGTSTAGEVNSTTTVVRVTMPDGQRAMILGDATTANESLMNKVLHRDEFKCRIVQVAHHAWNALTTMYKNIAPEYALWPQYEYTNFVEVNRHRTLAYGVAAQLDKCGVKYNYFSGLNTAKLTCRSGDIEVTLADAVY